MPRRLVSYLLPACISGFGLFPAGETQAVKLDFRGQLSGWSTVIHNRNDWRSDSGLRYIPQFTVKQTLGTDSFLDSETSFNGFLRVESGGEAVNSSFKLYRLKFRLATARTETRLGLQKISFGPAYLLRSLRWFDRLDPRDPLKIADGIYGLRFKYSAANNANLWLWSLYGNEKPKGYEAFPTAPGKPEFGGRFQYPVAAGEVAATFHSRRVNATGLDCPDFRENRLALDGRWDVKVGLWFESVIQQQKTGGLPYRWTKMITIGSDYTLGVGNGLHIMAEHMAVILSDKPFSRKKDMQFSAVYLNYVLGLLDKLTAIGYYSWQQGNYYQYLCWQRLYDNLVFNIGFFRYPRATTGYAWSGQNVPGSGYGMQLVVIYNH